MLLEAPQRSLRASQRRQPLSMMVLPKGYRKAVLDALWKLHLGKVDSWDPIHPPCNVHQTSRNAQGPSARWPPVISAVQEHIAVPEEITQPAQPWEKNQQRWVEPEGSSGSGQTFSLILVTSLLLSPCASQRHQGVWRNWILFLQNNAPALGNISMEKVVLCERAKRYESEQNKMNRLAIATEISWLCVTVLRCQSDAAQKEGRQQRLLSNGDLEKRLQTRTQILPPRNLSPESHVKHNALAAWACIDMRKISAQTPGGQLLGPCEAWSNFNTQHAWKKM